MTEKMRAIPYIQVVERDHSYPAILEVAVTLSRMEEERRKDRLRGLFVTKQPEQVTSMVKALWPFRVISSERDQTFILLDALGLFSSCFQFSSVNLTRFMDSIAAWKTAEIPPNDYYDLLRRRLASLSPSPQRRTLHGLVSDPETLKPLVQALPFVREPPASIPLVQLSSKYSLTQGRQYLRHLSSLAEIARNAIEHLNVAIASIRDAAYYFGDLTKTWSHAIRREIDSDVQAMQPRINQALRYAEVERNTLTQSTRRRFDEKMHYLEQRLQDLERTERHAPSYRASSQKRRVLREIKHLQEDLDRELQHIDWEYESQVSSARARTPSLESQKHRQLMEMQWLEKAIYEASATFIKELRELLQANNALIAQITHTRFRISPPLSIRTPIHLPLYIGHYSSKRGNRYQVFFPVRLDPHNLLRSQPWIPGFEQLPETLFDELVKGVMTQIDRADPLANILNADGLKETVLEELATLFKAGLLKRGDYFKLLAVINRSFTA